MLTIRPAGFLHGYVVGQITTALAEYLVHHPGAWLIGGETGLVLEINPDTVRSPDIAVVRSDRLADGETPISFFQGAPDLVVEVISPRDTEEAADAKARQWVAGGARLVWNVWPLSRMIHIYRPASPVEALDQSGTLAGEPVLPGFQCAVRDIFPAERK